MDAKCKLSKLCWRSKNQSSEIRIDFVCPYSGSVLEASVDFIHMTADEAINEMIDEGFICSTGPVKPKYVLRVRRCGRSMCGEKTFQDAGATDGCEVQICISCSDIG